MSPSLRELPAPTGDLASMLRAQTRETTQHIARLSTANELQDPLGFEALRELAMVWAQGASRSQWTDYNLHDPGVTLLEALCYALTEDIYASRQSVPELLGLLPSHGLTGGDEAHTIPSEHLARHALQGPLDVLTCRPSTARDYQRWLYDLWPTTRHLQIRPLKDRKQRPTGLWHLSRQARQADSDLPEHALAQTKAYWAHRNLGEDLLGTQELLKPRWVRLRIRIRVSDRHDLAELLAAMLTRCDDFIAARPQRRKLEQAPDAQRSAGPLMAQGWVSDAELDRCGADELRFNDLALYLDDLPGLVQIEQLELEESPTLRTPSAIESLQPLVQHGAGVALRGDGWALRLAWPANPDDLQSWSVIDHVRNHPIPLQHLWQQLEDVRRTPRREAAPPVAPTEKRRLHGYSQPASAYLTASSHLPQLYRSTRTGLSTVELQTGANGQMLQWHAYLALLEQWLAHSRAQRQHLGDLFDIGRALHASYWWDLPGNNQLRGLESTQRPSDVGGATWLKGDDLGLYSHPRERLEADIFRRADNAVERRSRVLDQLLAMHGEHVDFQVLRGLPSYWQGAAWSRHLLRCKQRFARHLMTHTGGRGAAFDYSRPMLGRRDNPCPLSQRLALQLGMAHPFPRRLMTVLQVLGLHLQPEETLPTEASPAPQVGDEAVSPQLQPVGTHLHGGAALRALWLGLRERLALLRQPLPPALLRSAVHGDRFVLLSLQGRLHLCLNGERRQQQWQIAPVDEKSQALQLAAELHRLACALNRRAEGLHLVEHVLLRPAGQPAEDLAPFHRHRLSLVMPSWTARGADLRFQSLCRDTLRMHAPAHLESRVLFIDAADMADFEDLYAAWLDAKRAFCASQHQSPADMDASAAALSEFLRAQWNQRHGKW